MKSMNSLERCMAVLNGETPDRLPIVPQCFMLAVETAGLKISDVNRNGRKMAQAHIISQEKYGYDGCVIDFDDATIAEAVGAKVIYREDEPAIVDEEQPVLKDLRDVYDMPIPDPASSGRLNEWLEATRTLSEAIGDHVFIMGRADQGPFSIACLLRGTTQFMMDLLTEDKQLIDDVLEYCRKISAVFAKAQKDAGAHVTSIGDAFAGPNLISPDMYRQFALIPEQKLAKEVQDYGIPFSIHICGNTNGIIQDMGTTGAKILEVDWMLDIKEARRLVPEDTVLMGNIDPSSPLVIGTPSDVDAAVKRLIEATKGKRHIISSGCAMGRNTPPENFKAFIEAAHRYGSYEEIMKLQNL
ncbi:MULTISPECIES: uroporphyrinogen decarboxylase family protein [Parabacteroides]|uniref:uroporphyrinogen decarboxylase family protein n=1 Tax=Parabacteroides TaxID=375288 RepID=UPI00240D7F21|nr:uroporphyrinogen decarboxylase family protein [Parabacteroides chongii]WFE85964.1 uroporphyrinogen decarboxylase family protein [Parabacteroides chongii]